MPATIRKGSRGEDVRLCQERLSYHGHKVSIDGIFGQGTHSAVVQFQHSRNLDADGIVGSSTWGQLLSGSTSRDSDIGGQDALEVAKRALLDKIPDGLSGDRRRTLEAAISDLGADEVPDGSNWGDEIVHLVGGYNEFWGLSTAQYGHLPWCAMACSSWIGVGLDLGRSSSEMDWSRHPFGKFFGGAQQIEDWGRSKGCWVEEYARAEAGAVFSMSRSGSGSDSAQSARAGHVGLVVCDNGDGTVTTIEGNVSNGVRSYTRSKPKLKGFIEWWRG